MDEETSDCSRAIRSTLNFYSTLPSLARQTQNPEEVRESKSIPTPILSLGLLK